jgi:hypothetical protein
MRQLNACHLALFLILVRPATGSAQAAPNAAQEAKPADDGPSLAETVNYILSKFSGTQAATSTIELSSTCGVNKSAESHSYTLNAHDRSLEVTSRLVLTGYMVTGNCWFQNDGQFWSGSVYDETSHYTITLRDIALDGIRSLDLNTKEPCTPTTAICVLDLRLTKKITIQNEFVSYTQGRRDGTVSSKKTGSGESPTQEIGFWMLDPDTVERLVKAFTHAAILSGAKKDLF